MPVLRSAIRRILAIAFTSIVIVAGCGPSSRSVEKLVKEVEEAGKPTPKNDQPVEAARVSAPFYTPLQPYPFDPKTKAPNPTETYEGFAPETEEALQSAIQQQPDSNMAKAQEFFTDENGRKKWRYTKELPYTPEMSLVDFSIGVSEPGADRLSACDGTVTLRNMTPFKIMDYQVVLFFGDQGFTLVPPDKGAGHSVESGNGVQVSVIGCVPQDVLGSRTVRMFVEATIDGPPGIVRSKTSDFVWQTFGR